MTAHEARQISHVARKVADRKYEDNKPGLKWVTDRIIEAASDGRNYVNIGFFMTGAISLYLKDQGFKLSDSEVRGHQNTTISWH